MLQAHWPSCYFSNIPSMRRSQGFHTSPFRSTPSGCLYPQDLVLPLLLVSVQMSPLESISYSIPYKIILHSILTILFTHYIALFHSLTLIIIWHDRHLTVFLLILCTGVEAPHGQGLCVFSLLFNSQCWPIIHNKYLLQKLINDASFKLFVNNNLWLRRLSFLKMVTTVSPILHILLTMRFGHCSHEQLGTVSPPLNLIGRSDIVWLPELSHKKQ